MAEDINSLEQRVKLLELKSDNVNLVLNDIMNQTMGQFQIFHDDLLDVAKINQEEHMVLGAQIANLVFEINDPNTESDFFYPKFMQQDATINMIIQEKKSLARFGDGEFSVILGYCRQNFQRYDEKLQKRLLEVLQSDDKKCLIAIADNYGNLKKYTEFAANGIRTYMQLETRLRHMEILSREKIYHDAYVTRPYVMYRDQFTDAPAKRFAHLKQIWDGRDVIMIEGAQTRLGVGNDLFDNCASIRRILLPPKNSFSRYEDGFNAAKQYASEDVLFLIAAGPCAGVFAYDLTMEGYQAVDIGHLDVEYEWFKKGTGEREPLPHKYTQEVKGDEAASVEIDDPVYESQIIAKFIEDIGEQA